MLEYNNYILTYRSIGIRNEKRCKRKHIIWYAIWDVASGCIWNTDIISNTELIYEKSKNKYLKVVKLK